ncbi:MAG: SDR family NAD(P)-dependent oxidoreductase [Lachnospiraceae bacterium]|nr:SDR family NAD(P)-dependent oxidoreductase [Lachnospiraceae bacterium]
MKPIALVTGASRGIGKEIARMLAMHGYTLHLVCNKNITLLQELAAELEATHGTVCHLYCGDVGNIEFVSSVFQSVPRVDVLINCAGISHFGLLSDMTPAEWDRILSTNLSSVFYTCKYAVPGMVQAHKGCIINISSVWGNVGASMEAAYSATKGGVNALTKALAKELAPSGIAVNAIACGLIDTTMNGRLSEEEIAAIVADIPADRMGTPKEVADMVWHLLQSPSYLTGQIITLDGGWT